MDTTPSNVERLDIRSTASEMSLVELNSCHIDIVLVDDLGRKTIPSFRVDANEVSPDNILHPI